jgi:hypothetical protein
MTRVSKNTHMSRVVLWPSGHTLLPFVRRLIWGIVRKSRCLNGLDELLGRQQELAVRLL